MGLLSQDRVWIEDGKLIPLKELQPQHRRNLIAYLERNAEKLKWSFELAMLSGLQPSGDMACDAFDSEMEKLERTSGIDWLNGLPLMIELRRIEKKYNSPERLRKLQVRRAEEMRARLEMQAADERERNGWER
jgi:hypothetical protein